MGVRLYPNTKNVASLETLCGVPAGTHARLVATQERHKAELVGKSFHERQEPEYRQWKEINDDDAMGTLDAFLTFGWGRFRDSHGVAPDYAGTLTNPVHVVMLLRDNGINVDHALCEGLHWC